jgi:ribosomal protein L29
MTTEIKQTIIGGVMEEAGNRSVEELAQEENEMLLGLLSLRTRSALRLCRPKGVAKCRRRLDGEYDMRRIPSQLRKYFQKNFHFYVSYSKLIY